jgi:uncharacterized protein YbaR (Trm112 family)
MITCPHCKTELDVVGATEATEILGISTTWGYKQRQSGKWPEPISDMPQLWLRAEIEALALVQDEARRKGEMDPVDRELHELLRKSIGKVRRGKERKIAEEHLDMVAADQRLTRDTSGSRSRSAVHA